MDATYLFECFHEHAKVVSATVLEHHRTGIGDIFGYVEFASHSEAAFVMESYNGERMPNFNYERFQLEWDTDGFALQWRWNDDFRNGSFFGKERDADEVAELYPVSLGSLTISKLKHPIRFAEFVGHIVSFSDKRFKPTFPDDVEMVPQAAEELYISFEEASYETKKSCYVVRSIKLSELLDCRCIEMEKCKRCAVKTRNDSLLRQRAWLEGEGLPMYMSSQPFRSQQFIFGCGATPIIYDSSVRWENHIDSVKARLLALEARQDVYSFDAKSTCFQKLSSSFPQSLPGCLLFEVDGVRYCFMVKPEGYTWKTLDENPSWEELKRRCHGWVFLPDPEIDSQPVDNFPCLRRYVSLDILAWAVVGSKILMSCGTCFPIIYLDVNDEKKEWRRMPSLFDGKSFPFEGRALVLDLDAHPSTHCMVMFSFRNASVIYVSHLKVDDVTGDIRICCEDNVWNVMSNFKEGDDEFWGYTFVHLEGNKVAFVTSTMIPSTEEEDIEMRMRVHVVVIVLAYEIDANGHVVADILATRDFKYNSHSSALSYIKVNCGFVF